VARAGPTVIALDVQLNSVNPAGDDPYSKDNECLLQAVHDAARSSRVVLATDIAGYNGKEAVETTTIYQNTFRDNRITRGYIELVPDVRNVPLTLLFEPKERIDSFSEAIVRAFAEEGGESERIRADWVHSDHGPLANFNSREEFEKRVRSAADILPPNNWITKLNLENGNDCVVQDNAKSIPGLKGKIVLIGGDWSALGPDRGNKVDLLSTPAGDQPGVYIHANYVESFLTNALLYRLPKFLESTVEIVVSLALATVLVWKRKRFKGSLWPAAVITLLLLLFSYLLMMLLGYYFDFVLPAILVLSHWFYHQLNESRRKSRLWDDLPDEVKAQYGTS